MAGFDYENQLVMA